MPRFVHYAALCLFCTLLMACSDEAQQAGPGDGAPALSEPATESGGASLSPDRGYVHADSGVGFEYPGDPWRAGRPTTTPQLSGVRLTPIADRFGERLEVHARWSPYPSAPPDAGGDWLRDRLRETLSTTASSIKDLGTHEAAGVTWHVLETHDPASGQLPDSWERMYVHALRRDGQLYKIELRIWSVDQKRFDDAAVLLQQFQFPK